MSAEQQPQQPPVIIDSNNYTVGPVVPEVSTWRPEQARLLTSEQKKERAQKLRIFLSQGDCSIVRSALYMAYDMYRDYLRAFSSMGIPPGGRIELSLTPQPISAAMLDAFVAEVENSPDDLLGDILKRLAQNILEKSGCVTVTFSNLGLDDKTLGQHKIIKNLSLVLGSEIYDFESKKEGWGCLVPLNKLWDSLQKTTREAGSRLSQFRQHLVQQGLDHTPQNIDPSQAPIRVLNPDESTDQDPETAPLYNKRVLKALHDVIRPGMWGGQDTLWKLVSSISPAERIELGISGEITYLSDGSDSAFFETVPQLLQANNLPQAVEELVAGFVATLNPRPTAGYDIDEVRGALADRLVPQLQRILEARLADFNWAEARTEQLPKFVQWLYGALTKEQKPRKMPNEMLPASNHNPERIRERGKSLIMIFNLHDELYGTAGNMVDSGEMGPDQFNAIAIPASILNEIHPQDFIDQADDSAIVKREAEYVQTARQFLEACRAAQVPIPQTFNTTYEALLSTLLTDAEIKQEKIAAIDARVESSLQALVRENGRSIIEQIVQLRLKGEITFETSFDATNSINLILYGNDPARVSVLTRKLADSLIRLAAAKKDINLGNPADRAKVTIEGVINPDSDTTDLSDLQQLLKEAQDLLHRFEQDRTIQLTPEQKRLVENLTLEVKSDKISAWFKRNFFSVKGIVPFAAGAASSIGIAELCRAAGMPVDAMAMSNGIQMVAAFTTSLITGEGLINFGMRSVSARAYLNSGATADSFALRVFETTDKSWKNTNRVYLSRFLMGWGIGLVADSVGHAYFSSHSQTAEQQVDTSAESVPVATTEPVIVESNVANGSHIHVDDGQGNIVDLDLSKVLPPSVDLGKFRDSTGELNVTVRFTGDGAQGPQHDILLELNSSTVNHVGAAGDIKIHTGMADGPTVSIAKLNAAGQTVYEPLATPAATATLVAEVPAATATATATPTTEQPTSPTFVSSATPAGGDTATQAEFTVNNPWGAPAGEITPPEAGDDWFQTPHGATKIEINAPVVTVAVEGHSGDTAATGADHTGVSGDTAADHTGVSDNMTAHLDEGATPDKVITHTIHGIRGSRPWTW